MNEWMNEWMNVWMNEWIYELMYKWMNNTTKMNVVWHEMKGIKNVRISHLHISNVCVTDQQTNQQTWPLINESAWRHLENVSVIYSSFMGGALSHRQHCNSYTVHNVTPCSTTRCCVVLPRQHENKHKREERITGLVDFGRENVNLIPFRERHINMPTVVCSWDAWTLKNIT